MQIIKTVGILLIVLILAVLASYGIHSWFSEYPSLSVVGFHIVLFYLVYTTFNSGRRKIDVGGISLAVRYKGLAWFVAIIISWKVLLIGIGFVWSNAIGSISLENFYIPYHVEVSTTITYSALTLILVSILGIFGAFVEEYVFRIVLLGVCSKYYGALMSAFITSLVFMLYHFGLSLSHFIFSMILSLIFIETKNYLLCVMLHLLSNMTTYAIFSAPYSIQYGEFLQLLFGLSALFGIPAIIITYARGQLAEPSRVGRVPGVAK